MQAEPTDTEQTPGISHADRRPEHWSVWVRLLSRAVTLADAMFNRFFSSAWNPLYQTGTIAILAFLVTLVTGLYLFLFYQVDAPYASVLRIQNEIPLGAWARAVHTYGADLSIVAILVHALKIFLAGRAWGPRTIAWISGVGLLAIFLACGWTGQIMAWDQQGQVVAVQLTRMLDLLPIFSVPIGRTFAGAQPVPGTFFFMNLFLHVCLPLFLALLLWIHLVRIVRPVLLPPRQMSAAIVFCLGVVGALLPLPLAPRADLLQVPANVPTDLFYNFWVPVALAVSPLAHLGIWLGSWLLLTSVPWWWLRRQPDLAPSWVNPDLCTGCTTCYLDCPFDAIQMQERQQPGSRSKHVAVVNPDSCTSCGICAGSCAPMGVGPPAFTGRSQLTLIDSILAKPQDLAENGMVLFACRTNSLSHSPALSQFENVLIITVECGGNLHTSAIEQVLKRGASGVIVLTCPSRDAACREGPKWLRERVYNDREAELQARVDRRRVRICSLGVGEAQSLARQIRDLENELAQLGAPDSRSGADEQTDCEPKPVIRRGRF